MRANAFPRIRKLGHKENKSIFDGDVEITEKIDGSQLGFGRIQNNIIIRNKSQIIVQDSYPVVRTQKVYKLFQPAVNYILETQDKLEENVFYYAETLYKSKHNVLAYSSIPKNHIALFGYRDKNGHYCGVYNELCSHAYCLDINPVKLLHYGKADFDLVLRLLEEESMLGGTKIEGVVIKSYYPQFAIGKYVSNKFKERMKPKPKTNKTNKWEEFKESFRTEARWQKAVQHLTEQGLLFGEAKDIGPLMKEVQQDIYEEELETIANWLVKYFGKEIMKHSTRGLADWYKERLLKGKI